MICITIGFEVNNLDLLFPPKKTPVSAVSSRSSGQGVKAQNMSSKSTTASKTTTPSKVTTTTARSKSPPPSKATATKAATGGNNKSKQTMSTSPKKATKKVQSTTSSSSSTSEEEVKPVKRGATSKSTPPSKSNKAKTPAKRVKSEEEEEETPKGKKVQAKKATPQKKPAKSEEEEELPKGKKVAKKPVSRHEVSEEEEVKVVPRSKSAKKPTPKKHISEEEDLGIIEIKDEETKTPKKSPSRQTAKKSHKGGNVNFDEEDVVIVEEVIEEIETPKSTKTASKKKQNNKIDEENGTFQINLSKTQTKEGGDAALEDAKNKKKKGKFVNKQAQTTKITKIGTVGEDEPLLTIKMTENPNGIYEDYIEKLSSPATQAAIKHERNYLCNNYAPLPVVLKKGEGIYVQDIDGHWYMDLLSAYSAINHGHNDKVIIEKAYEQMNNLYMTSRAFYNNKLGQAGEMICRLLNYEKVLFMNSGVEAGESAVKLARRWGYVAKNIPDDHAKIVFAKGNFWGRTIYACGTSDDPTRYEKFGPYDRESSYLVEYNNVEELEKVLEQDPNICAVFLEPIQGENGVIIPDRDYYYNVKRLCDKYNCLLIDDEIQAGLGRAGFTLYTQHMETKPDIVLLGKSLSGGLYPVSAVLSSAKIMDLIKPGEHGSTYGGNPLAAQIVMASLADLNSRGLVLNSFMMGGELGQALRELESCKFIKEIRGRGLMFGLELHPDCPFNSYDLSLWLMERGLLTKSTKTYSLR
jgi:ornithine--oxo-acid transaminase